MEHSEKQYIHIAMVFKHRAFFPRMPWFLNLGHSEEQYSHNAMVFKQGAFFSRMPWFLLILERLATNSRGMELFFSLVIT